MGPGFNPRRAVLQAEFGALEKEVARLFQNLAQSAAQAVQP